MRYRWLPEHEHDVMLAWDALCRKKYKTMMSQAKTTYKNGINGTEPKLMRPKWMRPPQFYICKKRWDSDEDIAKSIQMAKNRGVVFDDQNNVVSRAPPTWFGGNVSMLDRCPQMVSAFSFYLYYCLLF